MARHPLQEVEIQDQFGKTIQPGDQVAFLTICSHSPKLGRGVYCGTVNGCARILEDYNTRTFHDPETGEDLTTDWKRLQEWASEKIGAQPPYPNWRESDSEVKRKPYDEWSQKYRDLLYSRKEVLHPAKRNRSLRNNILFKLEV